MYFYQLKSCNGSPQQITFQSADGKLPHSCCRAFWAMIDRSIRNSKKSYDKTFLDNAVASRAKKIEYTRFNVYQFPFVFSYLSLTVHVWEGGKGEICSP